MRQVASPAGVRLHRRRDRRAPPQAHLTVVATVYRDTDMSFWLEQAEAELER